jgi:OOP family OmpA-OmpF porin
MKPDALTIGAVLVAVAAVALFVIWLQQDDPPGRAVVQGLAGPQPESAPPAIPAPSAPPPVARAAKPIFASVLFEFDRAVLRETEAAKLDRLLANLKANGLQRLDATGHADRIGPAAYNMKLSRRRAEVVKAYLVGKDIDGAAVRISARGELEPASGDACVDMGQETRRNAGLVECLQPDRRVEVTLIGGV